MLTTTRRKILQLLGLAPAVAAAAKAIPASAAEAAPTPPPSRDWVNKMCDAAFNPKPLAPELSCPPKGWTSRIARIRPPGSSFDPIPADIPAAHFETFAFLDDEADADVDPYR